VREALPARAGLPQPGKRHSFAGRGSHIALGGGFDFFLLTGVGHVENGGTLHVAFPPQIVEIGTAVHGAAIVPHDEIVHSPPMGIDELPLSRVDHKLID
jgi:hypothetical protein